MIVIVGEDPEAEAGMIIADRKGKGMIPDQNLGLEIEAEIEAGKMIGAEAAAGRMIGEGEEFLQVHLGNERIDKDNFINNNNNYIFDF